MRDRMGGRKRKSPEKKACQIDVPKTAGPRTIDLHKERGRVTEIGPSSRLGRDTGLWLALFLLFYFLYFVYFLYFLSFTSAMESSIVIIATLFDNKA